MADNCPIHGRPITTTAGGCDRCLWSDPPVLHYPGVVEVEKLANHPCPGCAEREERVELQRARIMELESRIKELTAYTAGPWRAWHNPPTDSRVCIGTEDFTHDTILYVSGDFANERKKVEAAMRIASILNKADNSGAT